MGAPMAGHLLAAGHKLFVRTRSKVPEALAGATVCASPKEVASAPTSSSPMLPDTPDVETVLFGKDGVASGLSKGKTVVDMSSISPMDTKAFAKKINDLGCDYLDAPVSGGEVGAKAASLTIMVGGPEATFERIKPLFELMGKNITLVGGNGDGQTTKVANQIIVALNIAAVGEALVFASKAGADPAKVRQALMGGFAVQPHPGSARRTHDQAHLQPGLPHRAAPEGPEPGAGRRARPRRGAAADGRRGAADAGLRRQRHAGPGPFGSGACAGADGEPRGREGMSRRRAAPSRLAPPRGAGAEGALGAA